MTGRHLLQEDPGLFLPAIAETGEGLVGAAEQCLAPENAGKLGLGGELEEYAQHVCVSMGIWGYHHLSSFEHERRMHFLQLVEALPVMPLAFGNNWAWLANQQRVAAYWLQDHFPDIVISRGLFRQS